MWQFFELPFLFFGSEKQFFALLLGYVTVIFVHFRQHEAEPTFGLRQAQSPSGSIR
jgi:hypothetical protein